MAILLFTALVPDPGIDIDIIYSRADSLDNSATPSRTIDRPPQQDVLNMIRTLINDDFGTQGIQFTADGSIVPAPYGSPATNRA